MNRLVLLEAAGLAALVLFACNPAATIPTEATVIPSRPAATLLVDTATPAIPIVTRKDFPQITLTTALTAGSEDQADASFPLAESGPYKIGNRKYAFNEENRNGRESV